MLLLLRKNIFLSADRLKKSIVTIIVTVVIVSGLWAIGVGLIIIEIDV